MYDNSTVAKFLLFVLDGFLMLQGVHMVAVFVLQTDANQWTRVKLTLSQLMLYCFFVNLCNTGQLDKLYLNKQNKREELMNIIAKLDCDLILKE